MATRLAPLSVQSLTLCIALGILWGTLGAGGQTMASVQLSDKVLHILAFTGLVLPAALFRRRWIWPMAGAAFGLGLFIEGVQPWFGRTRELNDIWANLIGISLGVALAYGLRWIWVRG